MAFAARVLLDSITMRGERLITFEVTFPRIVLAEFNTHRMLARNSASSRAIPVTTMLKRLTEDPYIPSVWGENKKGMQAGAAITGMAERECIAEWNKAMRNAMESAARLVDIGVHKQLTNRLLEPFMWHTALVTATDWDNFFHLRNHPDAHPDIQTPARLMLQAMEDSKPRELKEGEWHMPLLQPDEMDSLAEDVSTGMVTKEEGQSLWLKVSAGRSARVSYLTHEGVRDIWKDIELHDTLVSRGHMSPLEHVARPMTRSEFESFDGYAITTERGHVYRMPWPNMFEPVVGAEVGLTGLAPVDGDKITHVSRGAYCGNYNGWIQYRKTIPREADILGG